MRSSIIVVAYNSYAYLPACIESILSNLGPQDELIVVDNGSSDGSAELVHTQYPQVRLICAENTGYAGGNNCGAARAQGTYLVFLNPDTILRQGALSALIAPLEEQNDVAMTTACIVHMDSPEVINTCGNIIHYTGLTYCRGAGQPKAHYERSCEVDAVSGAAFAIRRDLFELLDGFDEHFFMYVEDTDLSWRAHMAGYRCMYSATAVVEHDYYASYTPTKAFYLDRNRHLMLLKNLELVTYLRMLPGLVLGEIVTWGFLLLKGSHYWSVKLDVYRWLWQQRGLVRTLRHTAQSQRRRADREVVGRMAYQLEFGQLAGSRISRLAAFVFHPAFWIAKPLFTDKGVVTSHL